MMEEKTNFEKSLLLVAKELERLSRIRQGRIEFEQEMAAAEGRPKLIATPTDPECDLDMSCAVDTSYDIDEIRHQNFLARNRITTRSNVIRTLVYRVPESAYVVKKTQVYIDEEPQPVQSEEHVVKKPEKKKKSESKSDVVKKDIKYNAEDMIMIDDDDDIIGGWSSEEEEAETDSSSEYEEPPLESKQKGSKYSREAYKSSSDNQSSGISGQESSFDSESQLSEFSDIDDNIDLMDDPNSDEYLEEDDEDDDETFSLTKRPTSSQKTNQSKKRKYTKRGPNQPKVEAKGGRGRGRGRPPKVVNDRALEPISSINVNQNEVGKKVPARNSQSAQNEIISNLDKPGFDETSQKNSKRNLRVTRSRSGLRD